MAKILLTGATGRLGTALLPKLLENGYSVRAIVRPGSLKPLPQGVERLEFDLASGALPTEAFQGIQKIVHLAALMGERPYFELYQNNAAATSNLLANCPPSVERMVMASSISLYAEKKGIMQDESSPAPGQGAYGKSKAEQEETAKRYSQKLAIIALRLGMLYGPNFTEGYYPIMQRIAKGKMTLLGDGKNRLPLLHVDDAVSAFLLALECRSIGFRAYNIVGESATQEQCFRVAAEELHAMVPHKRTPVLLARAMLLLFPGKITQDNLSQLTMDRQYSTELAEKEIGFRAKVKLADGIKQMARLFQDSQK